MKSTFYRSIVFLAALTGAFAAVPANRPYVSPDVHPDRTVTFRILAPKASEVTLEGGWMESKATVPLVKDDAGLWSVTVGPLNPTVYAYWFNLDGAIVLDEANQFIRERTGGSSVSYVDVPDTKPLPWSVRDVPHGTVETHWVKSATYGDTRGIWIYLPPGYDVNAREKYPVLYLFHGAGELNLSWVISGKANLIFDNFLADGKIKPAIVVMPFTGPSANAPRPPAPVAGAPAAGGPPNPTLGPDYILKEVMPWAEARFRILDGRKNRAIAGLSAGGALASRIALNHLDAFSQLGIFSSPIRDLEVFPDLVKNPAGVSAQLDVFWVGVGKSDPQIIDWLRKMDADLTKLGVKHDYHETDGAHDYAVWRWCLVQFAPLLFRN